MNIALGIPTSAEKQAAIDLIENLVLGWLILLAVALSGLAWKWPRAARPLVILVEESPRPTWTKDQPQPSPHSQQPHRRSQRARSNRIPRHMRVQTLEYNPAAPADCGYCCALRVAKKKVSRKAILCLRSLVAETIEEKYEEGGSLAGMDVMTLVNRSQGGFSGYLWEVKTKQWASQVEIAVMAIAFQVPLAIRIDKHTVLCGHGMPKSLILYVNKHFLLYNYRQGKQDKKVDEQVRPGTQTPPPWSRVNESPDITRVTLINYAEQEHTNYSQPVTVHLKSNTAKIRVAHFDCG